MGRGCSFSIVDESDNQIIHVNKYQILQDNEVYTSLGGLVDVNLDGNKDMLLYSGDKPWLGWFDSLVDFPDLIYHSIPQPDNLGVIEGFITEDFNQDGNQDFVVSLIIANINSSFHWYKNQYPQTEMWIPIQLYKGITGYVSICTGDFDGDSFIDLISGDKEHGTIALYKNRRIQL